MFARGSFALAACVLLHLRDGSRLELEEVLQVIDQAKRLYHPYKGGHGALPRLLQCVYRSTREACTRRQLGLK